MKYEVGPFKAPKGLLKNSKPIERITPKSAFLQQLEAQQKPKRKPKGLAPEAAKRLAEAASNAAAAAKTLAEQNKGRRVTHLRVAYSARRDK